MPGRPQVSIRLGTSGRADVERDFAAIGDSGEAQARRYQASWERASAAAESALERQAKAATRLASVGASPIQQQINASTGVGSAQSGNAKAAASALATELERAEQEARQLIAAIDPLFAAQTRYETMVARINAVRATGQLDEQRYQQLLANEKLLLDQATAAGQRNAGMRGQMRMGAQQLGFQMNDVASQMAMGTRASVIFAQQSAQVVQALQLMGGEGNAFLKFIGGPWGIALSVAVVALTPFIGKLFEAGQSIDDLVAKMKKEAQQSADNDRAHKVFANTLDGVTEALEKNRDALKGITDQGRSAADQALRSALASADRLKVLKTETEGTIAAAKAQIELNRARAQAAGMDPRVAGPALAEADAAEGRLGGLQSSLDDINRKIATAQGQVQDALSHYAVEAATRDKVETIKRQYAGLIESTRKRLVAEHATTEEILRQTKALKAQEDAAIKREQERNRKGPANAGGTAIFNEQIASFFDTAAKYRGLSETKDRGTLKSFLGDVDPEKTAWCAAFVNAVLAANGVKGSGSLAASSFLNFGKDDTKSPQRGDIAVVKTGVGDHVGFVDSVDKAGNVKMLAGNTGDKVAEATYSKKQVLAIRRPPTPSESAAADTKASTDAIQAQMAFDSEAQKLNQQYLQALGKVIAGYDAQASVQLMRAQGEHDAEAKEIASNLAAGKYGDATTQLAQSRAQQLEAANDQVLSERKAAIALESYVKSLQSQDAANERDAKFKLDGLEYQESIARTAGERRTLQLQIIDIEYREKEKHLQYLLALDQLLGNTEDAAKVAAELAHLPEEKKRDQDKAHRDTQSPFEAYRDSLNDEWANLGGTVQNDVVSAFKNLDGALADAIMKSKNFHDLWKNMKSVAHDFAQQLLDDLIKLAIRMMIIRPIMNALGGGSGAAFASGTEYAPGGAALVGEHGPELVGLPRGSKVSTAATTRRLLASNDNAGMVFAPVFHNDFRGADPSAVAAISQRQAEFEENLPTMIVATMGDAKTRFLWRSK